MSIRPSLALGVVAGVDGAVTGSDGSRLYWGLTPTGYCADSSAAGAVVAKRVKNNNVQKTCSKKRCMKGLSDAK
jgi:hypothetical protein